MGTPLDTQLLGLDRIHGPKVKLQCHDSWIGSGNLTCFMNSDQLICYFDIRPVPLER
jgi:hypothetical protein